jgi:cytochrome c-type protein NapC
MFGDQPHSLIGMHPALSWAAVLCALCAIAILAWYLFKRPPLIGTTKVLLLLGIGVFPVGTALSGNIVTLKHSKHRQFCGSCHVMEPWTSDSANLESTSLASKHARNDLFGDENCYACHQDYGMFGTVFTKITGMRHLYEYYARYQDTPVEEALDRIHIYDPLPNANCMHCHSTEIESWTSVGEHISVKQPVRDGTLSCVSAGCHGPAHPLSKDRALDEGDLATTTQLGVRGDDRQSRPYERRSAGTLPPTVEASFAEGMR